MYFGQSLVILLGLAYFSNAQSQSCPSITINDLGSTTEFTSGGLVSRGLVPQGETNAVIPVRIRNFAAVCDAAGDRINTSSFVSVVVEFQCNFDSNDPSLAVCSDSSNIVTRQYQFQCIEQNGAIVWETTVSNSNLFVQTLNPTATLSTPLANRCRRCIDDQQSARADPITHCDPCSSQCDRGQGRCYLGPQGDVCCNFYQQGSCTTDCSSGLVADSNFNCVCPDLTLANGAVSYSDVGSGVERDVGCVATHTCNPGFRLEVDNARAVENTRTCSTSGWNGQDFTCEKIMCPDLTIMNGMVTISTADRGLLSRAFYECNPGFALKGDGNRVCQMDSTWNGMDPECADCSTALQDPNCLECRFGDNGMAICTMCRAGYRAVDGQCTNEVCPALTLANGAVSYSDVGSGIERDVGSVATHTCNSRFRLEVDNAQAVENTRNCSTSGWDGQDFTCVKVVCPDISILNGDVVISPADRGLMSRTMYDCDPGYALKGNGNRVCQIDDTWNGTDPECADCSLALQDPNCLMCGFDDSGMAICTQCKTGYTAVDGQCTGDTSVAVQDANCAEYGFDLSGLPICRMCESGYEILNGRCEKEDLRSGISSHYFNGILLVVTLTVLCAIAT